MLLGFISHNKKIGSLPLFFFFSQWFSSDHITVNISSISNLPSSVFVPLSLWSALLLLLHHPRPLPFLTNVLFNHDRFALSSGYIIIKRFIILFVTPKKRRRRRASLPLLSDPLAQVVLLSSSFTPHLLSRCLQSFSPALSVHPSIPPPDGFS